MEEVQNEPESDRVNELKNERIALQKKTFTKWVNSSLAGKNLFVTDIFSDFCDGTLLVKLLECISGETIGKVDNGRQRIHKIENVSLALEFLKKSVKLESIGAEDIVDGKEELILGLLWTIISKFSIKNIQNESQEHKSIKFKETLLLWCQRKTNGYAYVDIKDFRSSWRDGMAFNALLHSHRPDLFDFNKLTSNKHVENLNHAFQVAKEKFSIGVLLDPEDVDVDYPDEISIMTYVSMIYQYFSKIKNEEKKRRLSTVATDIFDVNESKRKYIEEVQLLLLWMEEKNAAFQSPIPEEADKLKHEISAFKSFRSLEKRKKWRELMNIEMHFLDIQMKLSLNNYKPYIPPCSQTIEYLNSSWCNLEEAEYRREVNLKDALLRQERLSVVLKKFDHKARLQELWLDKMSTFLDSEDVKDVGLNDVKALLERNQIIETDLCSRESLLKCLSDLMCEIKEKDYGNVLSPKDRYDRINVGQQKLLEKLSARKESLVSLKYIASVAEELEFLEMALNDLTQLTSVNYGVILQELEESAKRNKEELLILQDRSDALNEIKGGVELIVKAMFPQVAAVKKKIEDLTLVIDDLKKQGISRSEKLEECRELLVLEQSAVEECSTLKENIDILLLNDMNRNINFHGKSENDQEFLVEQINKSIEKLFIFGEQWSNFQPISEGNQAEFIINDVRECEEVARDAITYRRQNVMEDTWIAQYLASADDVESVIDDELQLVGGIDIPTDSFTAMISLQSLSKVEGELEVYQNKVILLNNQWQDILSLKDQEESATEIKDLNSSNHGSELKFRDVCKDFQTAVTDKQACLYLGFSKIICAKLNEMKSERKKSWFLRVENISKRQKCLSEKCRNLCDTCCKKKEYLHDLIISFQHRELNELFTCWTHQSVTYAKDIDIDEETVLTLRRKVKKFNEEKAVYESLMTRMKTLISNLANVVNGTSGGIDLGENANSLFNDVSTIWKNLEGIMMYKEKMDLTLKSGEYIFEEFSGKTNQIEICSMVVDDRYAHSATNQISLLDTQIEQMKFKFNQINEEVSEEVHQKMNTLKHTDHIRFNELISDLETLKANIDEASALSGILQDVSDAMAMANEIESFLKQPCCVVDHSNVVIEQLKTEETVLEFLGSLSSLDKDRDQFKDMISVSHSDIFEKMNEKHASIKKLLMDRKQEVYEVKLKTKFSSIRHLISKYSDELTQLQTQLDMTEVSTTSLLKELEIFKLKLGLLGTKTKAELNKHDEINHDEKLSEEMCKLISSFDTVMEESKVFERKLLEREQYQVFDNDINEFFLQLSEKKDFLENELQVYPGNAIESVKYLSKKYLLLEVEMMEITKKRFQSEEFLFINGGFHDKVKTKLYELCVEWDELQVICKETVSTYSTMKIKESEFKNITFWADRAMDSLCSTKHTNGVAEAKSVTRRCEHLKTEIEYQVRMAKSLQSYCSGVDNQNTHKTRELCTAVESLIVKLDNVESILINSENRVLYREFVMRQSVEEEWIRSIKDNIDVSKRTKYHIMLKKHLDTLCNQICHHEPIFQETITLGKKCLNNDSVNAILVNEMLESLQRLWNDLSQNLFSFEISSKSDAAAYNFYSDINNLMQLVDEKIFRIAVAPFPVDLVSCERMILRNKHDIVDVNSMKQYVKQLLSYANVNKHTSIYEKTKMITVQYRKLGSLCRLRGKQLQESCDLFYLYFEAETFKRFMVHISKQFSSDDYGLNYDEVMKLIRQFDLACLALSVGNSFLQRVDYFCKVILEKQPPHHVSVNTVKQKIQIMWKRLNLKATQRKKKLDRARQFHEFNFQISHLMSTLNTYNQEILQFDSNLNKLSNIFELRDKDKHILTLMKRLLIPQQEIFKVGIHLRELKSRYPGKACQKLTIHMELIRNVQSNNIMNANAAKKRYANKIIAVECVTWKNRLNNWIESISNKLSAISEEAVDNESAKHGLCILANISVQIQLKSSELKEYIKKSTNDHKIDQEDMRGLNFKMEKLKLMYDETNKCINQKMDFFQFKAKAHKLERLLEVFLKEISLNLQPKEPESRKKKTSQLMLHSLSTLFNNLAKCADVLVSSKSNFMMEVENIISVLSERLQFAQERFNENNVSIATARFTKEYKEKAAEIMFAMEESIKALLPFMNHIENINSAQRYLNILEIDVATYQDLINELKESCCEKLLVDNEVTNKFLELTWKWESLLMLKNQCIEIVKESKLLVNLKQSFDAVKSKLVNVRAVLDTCNPSEDVDESALLVERLKKEKKELLCASKKVNNLKECTLDIASEYPHLSKQINDICGDAENILNENKVLHMEKSNTLQDVLNVNLFQAEYTCMLEEIKRKQEDVLYGVDSIGSNVTMKKEAAIVNQLSVLKSSREFLRSLVDKLSEDVKSNAERQLRCLDERLADLSDTMRNRKSKLDAQHRLHKFLDSVEKLEAWLKATTAKLNPEISTHREKEWQVLLQESAETKVEIDMKTESLSQMYEFGRLLLQDGLLTSVEVDSRLNDLRTGFKDINHSWSKREQDLTLQNTVQNFKNRLKDIEAWLTRNVSNSTVEYGSISSLHQCNNALNETKTLIAGIEQQKENLSEIKLMMNSWMKEGDFDADNEISQLQKRLDQDLKLAREKEEVIRGIHRSMILTEKINELLSWVDKQTVQLESILGSDSSKEQMKALSYLKMKLETRAVHVSEVERTHVNCSFSCRTSDCEILKEELMIKWGILKEQYDKVKWEMSAKLYNETLTNEKSRLETWMAEKEQLLNFFAINEEVDVDNTNKNLKDFLFNIRVFEDEFEKLKQDSDSEYTDSGVRSSIDDLFTRYCNLIAKCDEKREMLKQVERYLKFCKDVEVEQRWMESKLLTITNDSVNQSVVGEEKVYANVKFIESEFSNRQDFHSDLVVSGELLSQDHLTFPCIDETASTLLQFKHTCDRFSNVLHEKLKVLNETLHIHMLLGKCEDLRNGIEELSRRQPPSTESLDKHTADALLETYRSINIDLQAYWSSIDVVQNELEEVKKTSAYPLMMEKIQETEQRLSASFKEMSSLAELNESSAKDAVNFFRFKAESYYLDNWIQQQIDEISVDGIGENLCECESMLKDAEDLARSFIGKEDRISAFGELCQEIIDSDLISAKQIAKNTSNLIEMWNDVKDLLNNRLKRLGHGCKIHTFDEMLNDVNKPIEECNTNLDTITFDICKLQIEKEIFLQIQNEVSIISKQIEDLNLHYSTLNNEDVDFPETLTRKYDMVSATYSDISERTISFKDKFADAERVDSYLKETSQFRKWMEEMIAISNSHLFDMPDSIFIHQNYESNFNNMMARESYFSSLVANSKELCASTNSFSLKLHEEEKKVTMLWYSLVDLMSEWNKKSVTCQKLHSISIELELFEKWLDEQQNAITSALDFDSSEDIESCLQKCVELDRSFVVQDTRVQETSSKCDVLLKASEHQDEDSTYHEIRKTEFSDALFSSSNNAAVNVLYASDGSDEKNDASDEEITIECEKPEYDIPQILEIDNNEADNNEADSERYLNIINSPSPRTSTASDPFTDGFIFPINSTFSIESIAAFPIAEDDEKELIGLLKKECAKKSPIKKQVTFNEYHEISDGCGNVSEEILNDCSGLNTTDTKELPMKFSCDDFDMNYLNKAEDTSDHNESVQRDIEDLLKGNVTRDWSDSDFEDFEWSEEEIDVVDASDPPPPSFLEFDDDKNDLLLERLAVYDANLTLGTTIL